MLYGKWCNINYGDMNGLDLSRKYYEEFGKPMIKTKFANYADRIACGLVGEGSECLACDDEISQDHDWGAGFCMWLDKDDFKQIGKELQKEYDKLPSQFHGYTKINGGQAKNRRGVFEIESFYKKFIISSAKPKTYRDWLLAPESAFANCTDGEVFIDKLGHFTDIRNYLSAYYPDEIRALKIAANCISAGQSGQYNFIRAFRRNDIFTLKYTETHFCEDIVAIAFCINRTYRPFYKWEYYKLQELPVLGQYLYEGIDCLLNENDYNKKITIIEVLAKGIVEVLRNEGLSSVDDNFLVNQGMHIYHEMQNDELKKYMKIY